MINLRPTWHQWRMSCYVRKCTVGHVRPVKIKISLRIRAGWSESSLGAIRITKDAKFLHVDNEYCDQRGCAGWFESSLGAHDTCRRYVFNVAFSNLMFSRENGERQNKNCCYSLLSHLNASGAKFKTTFVVCFLKTKLRLERSLYVKLKD